MSRPTLTKREKEFLRHLDWCCWEDSENGGDGWCGVADFASSFGIGQYWARRVLYLLEQKGFAESRKLKDQRRLFYAPTEAGSGLINPQRPDTKRLTDAADEIEGRS